jgi:hypothetical protein
VDNPNHVKTLRYSTVGMPFMKSALPFCFAALALAGCAHGPEYWDHGEWLDRVSVRPATVVPHTSQQVQQLQSEADGLRKQGEAIRLQMASEQSRDRRMARLRQLEEVGDELRPVEKALQGGPMPWNSGPTAQPGDAGA